MSFRTFLLALLPLVVRGASISVDLKPTGGDLIAQGWFGGWHEDASVHPSYSPSNVSWSKYNSVVYAFAESSDDAAHFSLPAVDATRLKAFVDAAHQHGVKAKLALGGWTGSKFFSYAFGNAANRTASVKTILNWAKQYQLDGFDIDWEYPNAQGIGCNIVKPTDSSLLLSFLQLLRADPLGKTMALSAAVVGPFRGSDGEPMTDVSAFAKVLDYVEIMNYDIYGNWSTYMGPNAPLDDSCAPRDELKQGGATEFVDSWVDAGFPPGKIVLAVAGYGHTFFIPRSTIKSNETLVQYPTFDASRTQGPALGNSWNGEGGVDSCGVYNAAGGSTEYWGLVQMGFLDVNGDVKNGVLHAFDTCSQTDYVYNPVTQVGVSYDSPRAFAAKGAFIKKKGLKGFAMWEIGGDYRDGLVDAIRSGAGYRVHH